MPVEKEQGLRTREARIGRAQTHLPDWVRQVCRAKGLSDDQRGRRPIVHVRVLQIWASTSPARTSTACAWPPNHCTRTEFFDTLKAAVGPSDVTNLRSVETAVVPIMTFDFCEVNIDLLFAHLLLNAIPRPILMWTRTRCCRASTRPRRSR